MNEILQADIDEAEARFWPRVDVREPHECWEWTGTRNGGYGSFSARRILGKGSGAHRFAFFLEHGYAPTKASGIDIDHLCRNRACVNVRHLEAVPHRINMLRGDTFVAAHVAKTHCPQGHPYTPENTRIERHRRGNRRHCRTCEKDTNSRRIIDANRNYLGLRPRQEAS